jgi:Family of unknown function (DUF6941)
MLRLLAMIGAERFIRDAETGLVSAINIIEHAATRKFPAHLPQLNLMAIVERTPDEKEVFEVVFRVFLGRKKLFELTGEVDFAGKMRNRLLLSVGGVAIPKAGTIRFTVDYEGRLRASYAIQLEETPERAQISQASKPRSGD